MESRLRSRTSSGRDEEVHRSRSKSLREQDVDMYILTNMKHVQKRRMSFDLGGKLELGKVFI